MFIAVTFPSHGLQPLDNDVFNATKTAYWKELAELAFLTVSAQVDKINFIRAYAKAREVGMTSKNILSGWRITGNWPISRVKALRHPEIQEKRRSYPRNLRLIWAQTTLTHQKPAAIFAITVRAKFPRHEDDTP